MDDYLFSYLDDLLRLQSEAAERHNHNGVLGAVREEFVVQVLRGRIDNIKIHNGEVVANAGDMGQHDIIIRKAGTLNPEHGGQVRINAQDCSSIIEVKSNAKGSEIKDFDDKAELIKADCQTAICGMVCYKVNLRKENVLRRFGYKFDRDVDGFIKDDQLPLAYNSLDFILCLDDEFETSGNCEYSKAFFIKKGFDGNYNLFIEPPYMKYFLLEVNSAANPMAAA